MNGTRGRQRMYKAFWLGKIFSYIYLSNSVQSRTHKKLTVLQRIELLALLWNQKVHYRVHKTPPLDPSRARIILYRLSIWFLTVLTAIQITALATHMFGK
jgi:hypothetical protein